jgi:hypothetical protein
MKLRVSFHLFLVFLFIVAMAPKRKRIKQAAPQSSVEKASQPIPQVIEYCSWDAALYQALYDLVPHMPVELIRLIVSFVPSSLSLTPVCTLGVDGDLEVIHMCALSDGTFGLALLHDFGACAISSLACSSIVSLLADKFSPLSVPHCPCSSR